jgi:PAS domain S-box-containing protein
MILTQQTHIAFHYLQNAALLALGMIAYCRVSPWLQDRLAGRAKAVFCGLFFGSLGAAAMLTPLEPLAGLRLDLRSAVVVAATLFGGIDAGMVTTAILALFRAALGGAGVAPGIFGLLIAFGLSAGALVLLRRRKKEIDHLHLAGIGLTVGAAITCVFVLYPRPETVQALLSNYVPTWIAMLTVSIVFLGTIILHFERARALDLALKEKERELRAILDNAPFAITLKDREGRYRLVNRCFTEWTGNRPEDVYGRTIADLYSPALAQQIMERDRILLEDGEFIVREWPLVKATRGIEHVLATKFPIRDDDGKITGIAGFVTDITARKRAEDALREKERELRAILDNAPLGIFFKDREGRFRLVNSYCEKWFGLRPEELYGRTSSDVFPSDLAQEAAEEDRRVLERGETIILEQHIDTIKHHPGFEHSLLTKFPIRDESGQIIGVAGFIDDITERKRAEEALRWSEERFRALIEHSNDMIVVVQPDGTITYRGPSMLEGLGYSGQDLIGRPLLALVHRDDVESVAASLSAIGAEAGRRGTGRARLRHCDGRWRHIAWSARNAADVPGVDGIIINARDVTEASNLEAQLLQAQKMEAVGQLAGGIAHDFNNILGAVLGFAGFLLQDLPKGTRERGYAERIVKASERAKELVQQILAFSRRTGVERMPTDLVPIVREAADMLRGSLPSSTRLEVMTRADALVADVNAAQISQLLVNLCINANDALAGNPGSIAIDVSRATPGELEHTLLRIEQGTQEAERMLAEGCIVIGALKTDRAYARLTIADTGTGIAPDVLKHIFEPFYTTKDRGRGTVLGLAVVHGIVTSYEGACIVSSRPGRGSDFAVYLPLVGAAPTVDTATRSDMRGTERILVVDDEPDVSDVLTTGLDRLGYEAVGVNGPEQALEAFAEDPAAWDLVVSDQVMPGMKGVTLFERLKAIRPTLRFILCTGFGDNAAEAAAFSAGVDAFLLKPVSPERLAVTIRRLVGTPLAHSAHDAI